MLKFFINLFSRSNKFYTFGQPQQGISVIADKKGLETMDKYLKNKI